MRACSHGADHDRSREIQRIPDVELRPGAILVLKGTMGCATFRTASARADCGFDGPNGILDGIAAGKLEVSSWNGGCCVGPTREVQVPEDGIVVLDFTEQRR